MKPTYAPWWRRPWFGLLNWWRWRRKPRYIPLAELRAIQRQVHGEDE